jgi:hypothetical protein
MGCSLHMVTLILFCMCYSKKHKVKEVLGDDMF